MLRFGIQNIQLFKHRAVGSADKGFQPFAGVGIHNNHIKHTLRFEIMAILSPRGEMVGLVLYEPERARVVICVATLLSD
jgi:hypothetical protein